MILIVEEVQIRIIINFCIVMTLRKKKGNSCRIICSSNGNTSCAYSMSFSTGLSLNSIFRLFFGVCGVCVCVFGVFLKWCKTCRVGLDLHWQEMSKVAMVRDKMQSSALNLLCNNIKYGYYSAAFATYENKFTKLIP